MSDPMDRRSFLPDVQRELGKIEYVPEPLSLEWMARLVEIAHQTSNPAIRDGALQVLIRALNPMLRVRMDS